MGAWVGVVSSFRVPGNGLDSSCPIMKTLENLQIRKPIVPLAGALLRRLFPAFFYVLICGGGNGGGGDCRPIPLSYSIVVFLTDFSVVS